MLTAGCRLGSCRRRLAGLRCGASALGGPEGIGACEALVLACVPCLHRRRCSARGRLRRRRGRCRRLARPTRACLCVSGCATRAGYSRARRREEREGCRRPSPRARAALHGARREQRCAPGPRVVARTRLAAGCDACGCDAPHPIARRPPLPGGRQRSVDPRPADGPKRPTRIFLVHSSHGPVHVLRCSRHRKDAEEDAE